MTQSLKKVSLIVTIGTLASKIGGLVRQLLIAGTFGIGAAYDAYNYAYIIPGFFLILLGGINGPFHNSMVSVLSKSTSREKSYILSSITTITSFFLIFVTFFIFIFANQVITIIAPGLSSSIHEIAVKQLQIMSPIALFAGLIGLSFGALNASKEFLIPSISPVISSLTLIIFIGIFWLTKNLSIFETSSHSVSGGVILAIGTLAGASLQWLFQIPYLIKHKLIRIKLIWDWNNKKVKEVINILGPATLSTGMLQINVFTDLFFASDILGAAAGLSYANFIIQAPLGLISNALIIPLLPTLSKLSINNDHKELIEKIRQGLIFSSISMIALGSLFISLGEPIVQLIYQRGSFNNSAVSLVTALLIAYGLGMPAYLGRDLLVRIFYSLGDGKTPFRISTIGILLNIIFDWILIGGPSRGGPIFSFNFGAQGLVIATAIVNFISCSFLLLELKRKINHLPIMKLIIDISKITLSGFIAGIFAYVLKTYIIWPENTLSLFIQLFIAITTSLTLFVFSGNLMGIQEINDLKRFLIGKFIRS